MRPKVIEWALASSGCAALLVERGLEANSVSFQRWEDIIKDADFFSRVKWAKVKNIHRAVEKLYRSYGLEVSRLLDVCRQVKYLCSIIIMCSSIQVF